jgi:hypothetical protein
MERWERAAALGLNPPVEESLAVCFLMTLSHIMFAPIGSGNPDDERRLRGRAVNSKRVV